MLDRLASIDARYSELDRLLGDPEVMSDYEKIAEYSKERSNLTTPCWPQGRVVSPPMAFGARG